MANRIPPSLAWLIDKRARIDGELQSIAKTAARLQSQLEALDDLRANLAAFDLALSFHEIQVDVGNIAPILSKQQKLLKAPHGRLTKWILTYFRMSEDREIPTTEICHFVANEASKIGVDISNDLLVKTSVRYRLKALCERGILVRCSHRIIGKRRVSTWRLAI